MKHLLTSLLMVMVNITGGTVALADDRALDEVANLVNSAIDKFTDACGGDQTPPRVVPVAALRLQANVEPLEAKLNDRRERLKVHAAAFQDWASRVCDLSDDEQSNLHEQLQQQCQKLQDRWKRNAHRRNAVLSDYAPVAFTTFGGAADFLSRKHVEPLLADTLTDEHRDLLLVAFDERLEAIRTAMLDYAVSLVDDELFLTVAQRKPLSESLRDSISNVEDGVFTYNTRNYYLPYKPLREAVDILPDPLLTDIQRQQLSDAFENSGPGQDLLLMAGAGINSWQQNVDDAVARLQTRFVNAASLRASWLGVTLGLTPQQIRHLAVAGKGAAAQCAAAWKEQFDEQLKQHEGRPDEQLGRQVASRLMNPPSIDELDRNALWRHTVDRLGADAACRERLQFHRAALEGYLTAMLDKELWLTTHQRAHISVLVDKTLPESDDGTRQGFREVELLVIPLFRISTDDLADLLTKPQQSAWKELQDQFQVHGRTVVMLMQNGSRNEFTLPP